MYLLHNQIGYRITQYEMHKTTMNRKKILTSWVSYSPNTDIPQIFFP